ncbi:nitroreductase family protein [Desulfobotulus sp. H1]|uniref:Nitroreductase family protein n=1 Tax=Desulfobotulus pelophilus TaxID=2823377 RepID=A0ABT3N829_9BACT|nr:nitroreductase family protein [Desulfobotulus pelophilus]MCW7753613.1 nitroreductase family protein [Desulfobotulus pelophilus]
MLPTLRATKKGIPEVENDTFFTALHFFRQTGRHIMFMDLIRQRRSIRKFLDTPVEKEKTTLLQEAALRSPSSRSLNPWEFIFVTDAQLLTELSGVKPHGASFLKGAPLGIAVIADPKRCDVWVEDSSIATIFLQLAAESMGLKSCWIQIRERMFNEAISSEEEVRRILGIPENRKVLSILAVGYGAESLKGHPETDLMRKKIHTNTYGG